jgi:tetratricopeptide (TPR) repeat protein
MDAGDAARAEIQDLYDRGLLLQAYARARPFGPLNTWRSEAALLAGRLAWHLGARRLSHALHLRAWRARPGHAEAILYMAYTLRERQGPWAAWRFLEEHPLAADASEEVRAHTYALTASIAADFRDFETAEARLRRAEEVRPRDPWISVTRADVFAAQDLYEEARETACESLSLRTDYIPALARAAHLLATVGQYDEALEILDGPESRLESGPLSGMRTRLLLHRDRLDEAEACLERAAARSPLAEKDWSAWICDVRSELAQRRGDAEGALRHARQAGTPFHQDVVDALVRAGEEEGRSDGVRLAVPFVRQHHATCAPSSLASIALFWKRPFDPLAMAADVTYDGTPGHRARVWMEQAGWIAREFRLTAAVAHDVLARGLPFTLVTVQPDSAHEQVVAGIDPARGLLLIVDPGQPFVIQMLLERLLENQRPFGPRAFLVVPADEAWRLDGLELPDAALYDEMYHLERALDAHDREAAGDRQGALAGPAPTHMLGLRAAQRLADYDGDLPAALEHLRAILRLFPDSLPDRLVLLRILRAVGREAEADALREEIAGHRATSVFVLEEQAVALSRDARGYRRALGLARRALHVRPFDKRVLSLGADVFWRAGRRDESMALRRFAACLGDRDEALVMNYFIAARLVGDANAALAWLRQRHQRFRQSTLPLRTLFWALEEVGRADEGLAAVDEALRENTDGDLLVWAVEVYGRYGQGARAHELLEGARRRCRPGVWLRASARLAAGEGRLREALESWRQVLRTEPLAVDALQQVADLVAALEGTHEAIATLQQASQSFPQHYGLLQLWYQWARREGPEAAEGVLALLTARHPRDPWARREMALLLVDLRRFPEAEKEVEEARALEPDSSFLYAVAGRVLEMTGQMEQSRAAYRQSLRLDVNTLSSIESLLGLPLTAAERRDDLAFLHGEIVRQRILGDCLFHYREHAARLLEGPAVLETLGQGREARPDLWQAWAAFARQLVAMGRLDEAAMAVAGACERFPLVPQVWLERAQLAHVRANARDEREALESALAAGADWGPAVRRLAALHAHAGDLAGARHRLEAAVTRAPLDAYNHAALAEQLWGAGEREAALARLEQALALTADEPSFWRMLEDWHRELGTPDRTVAHARSLTERRPGDAGRWLVLGRLCAEPEQLVERIQALDRAIALWPQLLEAHDLKAEALAAAGRTDEALAACRPTAWGARRPRELAGRAAWIRATSGDREGAHSEMQALLDTEPDYEWGWARMAEWCCELGDLDGYRAAAEQLVRLAPHHAPSLGYRGDAHRQGGRFEAAKVDLRRALDLDPEYDFARKSLAELHLEHDDARAALRTLEGPGRPRGATWALGLRLSAHLALDDLDAADEVLRDLALAPEADAVALARVPAGFRKRDWVARANQVLEDLYRRPEAGPHAGRWAVAAAVEAKDWKTAHRRVEALGLESERGRLAACEYLEQAAQRGAGWRLRSFVRRHRAALRTASLLWGTTVYAFMTAGWERRTVSWAADWAGRGDAQPWMLSNLALALRRLGRARVASVVNARALDLARDHTTEQHALWLALEAAGTGATERAQEYLRTAGGGDGNDGYSRFLRLVAMAAVKTLRGDQPFAWFCARTDEAEKLLSGRPPRELRDIVVRLTWCLARTRGGWEATLRALVARIKFFASF